MANELMTQDFQGRWVVALKLHIVFVSALSVPLMGWTAWVTVETIQNRTFREGAARHSREDAKEAETERRTNERRINQMELTLALLRQDLQRTAVAIERMEVKLEEALDRP